MANNGTLDLFQKILHSESEEEVIDFMKEEDFWNDEDSWQLYGGRENNYSIIGAQQADPVSALIEKFVNSVDAVLIRECLRRDIHPEAKEAPKDVNSALQEYFGITKGNLANLVPTERTKLANEIGFVASGYKTRPNYVVFDRGEGQVPDMMPRTFLSLAESNKLRIPFVQGKFNMGGSGVLRFCGDNNLQLIATKRDPKINNQTDPDSSKWGFTIVRREDPVDMRKNSIYTYLAPKGEILKFDIDAIQIPEYGNGTQEIDPLEWGTIIKLYEYEIPGGMKTNILFDLYNEVSLQLPKVGLPIRFYERRDYSGHSLETTMSGLHVRLEEDSRDNLEKGFPTYADFNAKDELFRAMIFAFQRESSEKYKTSEGILFTSNGQTHGSMSKRFYTRKNVGMSYLSDSILIIVECDQISRRAREVLFMNSRDRLSSGDLTAEIERRLEEIINNHQGLRDLREKRRRESIEEKLGDSRPLKEVLDEIMKKSPSLSALFIDGMDIGNPFKSRLVGEGEDFEGKPHPTFFQLMTGHKEKACQINRRFRVQFETDVENEYFGRDRYPGNFKLHINGESSSRYVLNLWNGIATVTISLPDGVEVDDRITGEVWVNDDMLIEPFYCEFFRDVNPKKKSGSGTGKPKPPSGDGEGDRKLPDGFSLPKIIEIREEDWEKEGFDKYSALKAVYNGNEGYDFYLNLDNVFLRTEMKSLRNDSEAKLLEARFKYGILLIGLCILKDQDEIQGDAEDYDGLESIKSIEDIVFDVSKAVAPVILPMVDSLGNLRIEDITEEV